MTHSSPSSAVTGSTVLVDRADIVKLAQSQSYLRYLISSSSTDITKGSTGELIHLVLCDMKLTIDSMDSESEL